MEFTETNNPLSPELVIRSTDLRPLLGLANSTFHELLKKLEIMPDSKGRGSAISIKGSDVRKLLEARGFSYPPPTQVISFMMCKGGVGKTTSSFFLGQRLSSYGARVLLIDADSQANLTSAFSLEDKGIVIDEETKVLVNLVVGEKSLTVDDVIIPLTPTLHLLPSSPLNANLEARIRDQYKNPSVPIRKLLAQLQGRYDFIIFDCAPALSHTNASILCASTMVILPVAPDRFSQMGMEQTLSEIAQLEEDFHLSLQKRILFTRYDARETASIRYLGYILSEHEDKKFSVAIRTCAAVKNVILFKEDLFLDTRSTAKEDYDEVAREILGLKNFFGKSTKRRSREAEERI